MALRVRKNGQILCAAIHPPENGDTYLHDGIHYQLSVEEKVLVTEPEPNHSQRGEWWWKGNVPENVKIDQFYFE